MKLTKRKIFLTFVIIVCTATLCGLSYMSSQLGENNITFIAMTYREDAPYPSVMSIDDALAFKPINNMDGVADLLYSTAWIEGGNNAPYAVGETIQVKIVVRTTSHNNTSGGDVLQIAIVNNEEGSYTLGRVFDQGGGSYTGLVEVLWPGLAQLLVRVAYTRQEITASYRAVTKVIAIRKIRAEFQFEGSSEVTFCHPIASHLRSFIAPNRSLCNLTHINSGMGWFCVRPNNPALQCSHWTRSSADLPENVFEPMTQVEQRLKFNRRRKGIIASYNISMRGNVVRTPMFNKSCYKMNPSDLWQQSKPTGFFFKRSWILRTCKALPTNRLDACLQNKTIHLMGDSTMRQWQGSSRFHCERPPGVTGLHRIATCVNARLNLTVMFYFKNLPTYQNPWLAISNVTLSHARVLDTLGDDDNTIVVLHTFGHVVGYKADVYLQEIRDIKKGVVALLDRNPNIPILIKGPHFFAGEENRGRVYTNLLYDVYRDISDKVIFLNNMDVTEASCNQNIHPPDFVVDAMVDQMLSFACPP